jgi:hypothetical protein
MAEPKAVDYRKCPGKKLDDQYSGVDLVRFLRRKDILLS